MTEQTTPVADNSFKASLSKSLEDSPIVYLSRSAFHFGQDRNARPSSHPAYSEESIRELAVSISAFGGLIEPLIVTGIKPREETGFAPHALISGNRRTMALDLLAAETGDARWSERIPCRVAKSGNQIAILRAIQLIENAARRDLDAGSIAQSLIEIKSSFGDEVSMEDVCSIVGAGKEKIGVFTNIVELPQAVKDSISSGDIEDRKVFILADQKYEIADTEWAVVMRLAKQLSASSFRAAMDNMFTESDSSSTSSPKPKSPKGVTTKEIKKYYLPAVMERFASINTASKDYVAACENKKDGEASPQKPECLVTKYTERDVEARVIDALNVVAGMPSEKSLLVKVVKPFIEAINQTEDKDKASKKAVTARDKWIRKQVSNINKCLSLPIDVITCTRPYPTLADALTGVVTTWGSMTAGQANEAGFDLASELGDKAKKELITKEVHTAWVVSEKAKQERVAKTKRAKENAAAAAATA